MGMTDETEKKLMKSHNDAIRILGFERGMGAEAWKSFIKLNETFILEGEPMNWLGCVLYITNKLASSSSKGPHHTIVSVAKMLKVMNVSLLDFFNTLRKCCQLMEVGSEIKEHAHVLESNFNVSMVLFRKYKPIFADLFRFDSTDSPTKSNKPKKLKSTPPNVNRIFEFTWIFFIYLKSYFPNIIDDLVNSYHLLLAVCDFVYANAYISGRKDILLGPLANQSNKDKIKVSSLSDVPCIIDYLCDEHDGISVEAKSVSEYCLRKHVMRLFDLRLIKGNEVLLCDILDVANFESNMKMLNKNYAEYTLENIDERVFLGAVSNNDDSSDDQSNQSYSINNFNAIVNAKLGDITKQLEIKRKQNASSIKDNVPLTPLSGKRYLKQRDLIDTPPLTPQSPVSVPSSPPSLHNICLLRERGPSDFTLSIIQKCSSTPLMEKFVEDLSSNLFTGLQKLSREEPIPSPDLLGICDMSEKMFYKLLDSILPIEEKKPAFDPNILLNQEIFIKALFACACEIVTFSSKLKKKFPWILTTLEIFPYYFYKVIEVVVRYEDLLTREMVKHLNTIEESVLESLAWEAVSPIWKALIDSKASIPSCEDVAILSLDPENDVKVSTNDLKVDKLAALAGKESVLINSPGAPLADKFQSPQRAILKRKIDENDDKNGPAAKTLAICQSGKQEPIKIVSVRSLCNIGKLPKENKKPKRTGPLALFFRKFYYLASVRLLDMCDQLSLNDPNLRRKIWTFFELTIVNHVELMLNRHLDQLLMCSIYVICKVVDQGITFMDLMKCYRNQPQAQSHVYRNVLISPSRTMEDLKIDAESADEKEERGDIIKFYNNVYVLKVKELAGRFRSTPENDRIVLSPIPVGKCAVINGPRRISEKHPLYLRSYEMDNRCNSKPRNGQLLNYYFNKSPAKDLLAINDMVNKPDLRKVGKQLLRDVDNIMKDTASPVVSRKVKDIYADRLTAKKQDLNDK